MPAVVQDLLASLLKHKHVLVPVLAELLVDLVDRHVRDGLLRGLQGVGAEVGLLEVDGRVVQGDCHGVPWRYLLVELDVALLCKSTRYEAHVGHLAYR